MDQYLLFGYGFNDFLHDFSMIINHIYESSAIKTF